MDCLRKNCKTVTYKCKCESVYLCNDHIINHLSISKPHKIAPIDEQELVGSFEEVCNLISSQQAELLDQADLLVEYTIKESLDLVKKLEDLKRKYLDVIKQLKKSGFKQEHLERLRTGYKQAEKSTAMKQYFRDKIASLFGSTQAKGRVTVPLKSDLEEGRYKVSRETIERENLRLKKRPIKPMKLLKDKPRKTNAPSLLQRFGVPALDLSRISRSSSNHSAAPPSTPGSSAYRSLAYRSNL